MGQREQTAPTPSIPGSTAEFAAGLRALRVGSLRDLASRQTGKLVISKSTLSRYEHGSSLPPLKHHVHLDALYGGSGWVSLAVRALRRGGWDPWADEDGFKARRHAGIWPAEYGGDVWMKIKPTPDGVERSHQLSLAWGPWRCQVACTPGPEGALLITAKAPDKSAVSLSLTCNREVFVLFGAGDRVEDERVVIDINSMWT